MIWRFMKSFRFIVCCLSLVFCIYISHINIIKAGQNFGNDSIVTFGLYSDETGQIETSQPDYFFDHIRYGMAHGIYNYYKRLYKDNANFPSEVSIFYQRLLDTFGTDFFDTLASQRWLLNIYKDGRYEEMWLIFNRVPEISSYPIFEKRYNLNDKYTVELLPEGSKSSFIVFTLAGITSYCPYYINDNVDIGTVSSSIRSSERTNFTSLEDLKSALTNANVRSFCIRLNLLVPALTISGYSNMYYNAYYSSSTLTAFTTTTEWIDSTVPIMTDFPVFSTNDSIFGRGSSGGSYYTYFYYNRAPETLSRDYNRSPIIITGYEDIPQVTPTPTFTPTPVPTWTPYPTATPFPPVNEIEGLSQMMSLFTRKYEFNINGNNIGIRPLYLFVFTFLVGAIFKAIQGGDRS